MAKYPGYFKEEEKIIQIIPAPTNLFVEYENDRDMKQPIKNQVVCLALTDQGDIWVMDIDDSGYVDKADTASNFRGIVFQK